MLRVRYIIISPYDVDDLGTLGLVTAFYILHVRILRHHHIVCPRFDPDFQCPSYVFIKNAIGHQLGTPAYIFLLI